MCADDSMVGFKYHHSNKKALTLLQWKPRSAKETLDSANFLIDNKIVVVR